MEAFGRRSKLTSKWLKYGSNGLVQFELPGWPQGICLDPLADIKRSPPPASAGSVIVQPLPEKANIPLLEESSKPSLLMRLCSAIRANTHKGHGNDAKVLAFVEAALLSEATEAVSH